METIPSNVNVLEPELTKVISQAIKLHEDEIKEANINLKNVLLGKMEAEMKKDDTFRVLYKEPKYVGSFYENLRVGHPDEFDINLEFELPVNKDFIEIDTSNCAPGFTKIKVTNKTFKTSTPDSVKRKLESWLEKDLLDRDCVIRWMQGVVDRALIGITWPSGMKVSRSMSGPAVTLEVDVRNKHFDVDLVPVFRFGHDKWPSKPIRQADDIPRNVNTSSLRWCVVPKAPRAAASFSNYQWRMSFYTVEKELMRDLKNMKPVVKLFKLMRDKQGWTDLSSYYIKTLFMWEQQNMKHVDNFWRKGIGYLFMHMLNSLEQCLEAKKIKFFWHKNCNLISHVNNDCIENWKGRVRRIKSMLLRCLAEPSSTDLPAVMKTIFTMPSGLQASSISTQESAHQSHSQGSSQAASSTNWTSVNNMYRQQQQPRQVQQAQSTNWVEKASYITGAAALTAVVIGGIRALWNRNE